MDDRVLTPVLHVEGGSTAPVQAITIGPGASLQETAEQLGVSLRITHRREPWTQAELERARLEAEVADLRMEYPAGDYPPPTHPTRQRRGGRLLSSCPTDPTAQVGQKTALEWEK